MAQDIIVIHLELLSSNAMELLLMSMELYWDALLELHANVLMELNAVLEEHRALAPLFKVLLAFLYSWCFTK